MVPSPRGVRVNLARPPSVGGLVYDSHELHACDLCLPIPASADLGGGCIELILGRARCLCIPTNEDPEQGDQQSNSALLQDTAGGSSLAKATVVWEVQDLFYAQPWELPFHKKLLGFHCRMFFTRTGGYSNYTSGYYRTD